MSHAVTGYQAVRAGAKTWSVLSSDLQGERDVRHYRQYPLEADPPDHRNYRAILTPFLAQRRIATLEPVFHDIAIEIINQAVARGGAEVLHELALPMVVRSVGVALGRPQDADEWMTWGIGVWKSLDDGTRTSRHVDAYLNRVFDEVAANPGGDVFSAIAGASLVDRPLTRLEMMGLGNLVLAGGRDTVVQLISFIVWYLAAHTPRSAAGLLHSQPSGPPRSRSSSGF